MDWQIEEYDGQVLTGTYSVPGNISQREVIRLMKQLAARHLSPREIILSNLRRGMRDRATLLEVRNDNGILQVGEGHHLVARMRKA